MNIFLCMIILAIGIGSTPFTLSKDKKQSTAVNDEKIHEQDRETNESESFDSKACKPSYADIPWVHVAEGEEYKGDLVLDQGVAQRVDDKLFAAIVNNDFKYVSTFEGDLNTKIKVNFYVKEDKLATEILWEGTYLGAAVRKYAECTTAKEKKRSRRIIETLLKKGANPNLPVGQVLFQLQRQRCVWIDFPWYGPVTWTALKHSDAVVLKLLLDHGACANGRAPTYGDLLNEAKRLKQGKKIKMIQRYLNLQKKQGICPPERYKGCSFGRNQD